MMYNISELKINSKGSQTSNTRKLYIICADIVAEKKFIKVKVEF